MLQSNKKIIPIIFALSAMANAKIYIPVGTTINQLIGKPLEIAWDIHDTLCQKNKGEVAGIALSHLPTVLGNVRTIKKDIKKIKSENEFAAGELYVAHFEKNNKQKVAQFIEKISNAYKPTSGIISLLDELSQRGYTHRLASNIGKKHLTILNHKMVNRYKCNLFGYMNGGVIIDYGIDGQNTNLITKGPVYCALKPKPRNDLYQVYNKKYNPDAQKIIIFIDDKIKNIQAATDNGWVGIHFTSIKQLRQDLIELGLLPKNSSVTKRRGK
jgi:FMN phosphatase YigB (HAD superfamily)